MVLKPDARETERLPTPEGYTRLLALDHEERAIVLYDSGLSKTKLLRFLSPRPPFLRGLRPETRSRWELCGLLADGFAHVPALGLRLTKALQAAYPEAPEAEDLATLIQRRQLGAKLFHLALARDPGLPAFRAELQAARQAWQDTALLQNEVRRLHQEKAALEAEKAALLETLAEAAPKPRPRPTAYQDLVVGVFVDVPTLEPYARQQGQVLDFAALLAFVRNRRRLQTAIAYAVQRGRDFPAFRARLEAAGYQVKALTPVRRPDGSFKANWDVGIAQDILDLEDKLDVVALVSGDGDFVPLVERLTAKGLWVEVYGFKAITARDLKAAASCFVPLDKVLEGRPA